MSWDREKNLGEYFFNQPTNYEIFWKNFFLTKLNEGNI